MRQKSLLINSLKAIVIIALVWLVRPASAQTADFVQASDDLGLIVITAESFSEYKPGTDAKAGDSWDLKTEIEGFIGDGYMQSIMAAGDGNQTNAETVNAKLTYSVEFVKTGTHYLWAFINFPNDQGDSFFYGLDGSVIARVQGDPYGEWRWDKGDNAFVVAEAGIHTIDIMQREPNAMVDHIIITTDENFNPVEDSSWVSGSTNDVIDFNKPDFGAIQVYPNPAGNQLNISGVELGTHINVYNVTGQLLSGCTANYHTKSLNVSNLKQGMYFLKAEKDGQAIVIRFVKN